MLCTDWRSLRAKRYFNSALLIIDEVGFRSLDRSEANLFFRLVSAHYERGSIVLTSNKHVRNVLAVFADDEILTTAILDRFLYHVQVLHIDGRSYQLRELGALLGPRTDLPMHVRRDVGGGPSNLNGESRLRELTCLPTAGIWMSLHTETRTSWQMVLHTLAPVVIVERRGLATYQQLIDGVIEEVA